MAGREAGPAQAVGTAVAADDCTIGGVARAPDPIPVRTTVIVVDPDDRAVGEGVETEYSALPPTIPWAAMASSDTGDRRPGSVAWPRERK
ncbi:hypothetical protein ABIA38_003419 [Embleya sp. AB8]